jgi:hypothetical protein
MAFRKRFVLSDESINCYGFWIKASGMDLSGIKKNCPVYYEHKTWEIPLGHVENIELNNGVLTGDVVIEGGNDIEKEIIRKIENGDLKGCSIGFDPLEWSTDELELKQGQTRATCTKSFPFELSIAPLPGNKNALALKHQNNLITLAAGSKYDFIPDLNTQPNMKKIALCFGLAETATEDEIVSAAKAVQLKAANNDAIQLAFENTAGAHLPEKEKAFFVSLSKTNLPAAIEYLALNKPGTIAPDATAPAGVIKKETTVVSLIKKQETKTDATADGKETFDYMQRHDTLKLSRIKEQEPEAYAALVADYAKGVRYKSKA